MKWRVVMSGVGVHPDLDGFPRSIAKDMHLFPGFAAAVAKIHAKEDLGWIDSVNALLEEMQREHPDPEGDQSLCGVA